MNKSLFFTIKKVIFSIGTLLLFNGPMGAMEVSKQEKQTIQLYNVANKDITIGAYQQDKQGFARPKLDTIYTKPGQTKEEIKPFPIDPSKKWFVTITDQAEKSLPKSELPNSTNINVLDINKILEQQLTQKPWLKNRPVALFVKDAPTGYLAQTARALGYQWSPDLMVVIADQNPENNEAIQKNILKYRIENKRTVPLIAAHYTYNKDAGLYQFKDRIIIRTGKSIDQYNVGDKIFVTYDENIKFPFFETPKNTDTVFDLTSEINNQLKDRPALEGADLSIDVNSQKDRSTQKEVFTIAIFKESTNAFYTIGQQSNPFYADIYDISHMRFGSNNIIENKTISRILFYNNDKQELSHSLLNKIKRNLIILVPNEAQSDEFWKLSTSTMQAILTFVKQQKTPTEIVAFKWTAADMPETAAKNLATIINENYRNRDLIPHITIIGHEKGGTIANMATNSLARPIDSIYQIFTAQHEKTLRGPKEDNFNVLFNFYIEAGTEVLPKSEKGRLINLATTYINATLEPNNIAPVLAHLASITRTISDNYKLNNNLAVTIDANAVNDGSFVMIKKGKEAFFSDREKENQAQQEMQFSFDQLKELNTKYPSGIAQKAYELAKLGYEQLPSKETVSEYAGYTAEYAKAAQAKVAGILSSWFAKPPQIEQPKPQVEQVAPSQEQQIPAEQQLQINRQELEKESKKEQPTKEQPQQLPQPEVYEQKESKQEQEIPQKTEQKVISKEEQFTPEEEQELTELEKQVTEEQPSEKVIEQQVQGMEQEITIPETNKRILQRNIKRAQERIDELATENKNLRTEIKNGTTIDRKQKLTANMIERRKTKLINNLKQIAGYEQQKTIAEKQLKLVTQQK